MACVPRREPPHGRIAACARDASGAAARPPPCPASGAVGHRTKGQHAHQASSRNRNGHLPPTACHDGHAGQSGSTTGCLRRVDDLRQRHHAIRITQSIINRTRQHLPQRHAMQRRHQLGQGTCKIHTLLGQLRAQTSSTADASPEFTASSTRNTRSRSMEPSMLRTSAVPSLPLPKAIA
jgi:hypothetical protein